MGDKAKIALPNGWKRRLSVVSLDNKHLPKMEARALYEDVTLPLTAEKRELRQFLHSARDQSGGWQVDDDRRQSYGTGT